MFGRPECRECKVPFENKEEGHHVITQNWVNAISYGTPLLVPGEEGINGLMLSNAMYLSTWTNDWVNLPFDEDLFFDKLQEKITQPILKEQPYKSKS